MILANIDTQFESCIPALKKQWSETLKIPPEQIEIIYQPLNPEWSEIRKERRQNNNNLQYTPNNDYIFETKGKMDKFKHIKMCSVFPVPFSKQPQKY